MPDDAPVAFFICQFYLSWFAHHCFVSLPEDAKVLLFP